MRTAWRLLAELIVVFLGVYGAFWVEDYRERQDRVERTRHVILALQQDLNDYVEVTRVFSDHITAGLEDWDAARAGGEEPAPFVFRLLGAEVPPLTIWEAVLQSELPALLHANLLFDLAFFYNEISGMGDRYLRYSTFTESEVLPRMKIGSSSFYADDGTLLPQFEAHMDRLREYSRFMIESIDWASCLSERLERPDSEGRICRRDIGVTPI